ncbi:MAG: SUF system Fe-S cluster assembly regulator [Pseudomonadota bacterium]
MIRLSKLADYGIVISTHLAQMPGQALAASEIAEAVHLPQPMVAKILKKLARAELLTSQRGSQGGYRLNGTAELISVAQIIEALDGPIALTACIEVAPGECEIESVCPARANWQTINDAIRDALLDIPLAEMANTVPHARRRPMSEPTALLAAGRN